MRFDDKETRTARRAKDIFAPFREIWDVFNANLARGYVPGPVLTVDEQLMPWRGRCAFLQYLPSKPDKYDIDIKIFWICGAENGFPLHDEPYLGRKGRARETNLRRNTTIALAQPHFGSGRILLSKMFSPTTLSAHIC
ncbi:PiggyBac transposable element-derived protein 4 [Plakobranchus ocellatus]|uniref:PiggyBac transposable element-derived protein 4 n=1 Tax=Plakobranchus ocellatus TaxID=259542 RepID=A0AAV4DSQ0_9GAST|nr:PiggyBac transposable element-derived protein 4 [Plakobranchus ocellatus]